MIQSSWKYITSTTKTFYTFWFTSPSLLRTNLIFCLSNRYIFKVYKSAYISLHSYKQKKFFFFQSDSTKLVLTWTKDLLKIIPTNAKCNLPQHSVSLIKREKVHHSPQNDMKHVKKMVAGLSTRYVNLAWKQVSSRLQ